MSLTITLPTFPVTELLLSIITLQLFVLTRRVSTALLLLRSLVTARTAVADPPAAAEEEIEDKRLLRDSARLFAATLLGDDDVDVASFMKACRQFTIVLESLGPFTMIAAREVHSNMTKVEHT